MVERQESRLSRIQEFDHIVRKLSGLTGFSENGNY